MGFEETSGSCEKHGDVIVRRQSPNHVFHVLLTLITGGLWLLGWALIALQNRPWLCTRCGRPSRTVLWTPPDDGSGS